ncbi:hypothetical protein PybrP1_000799, partial [[Pythium] brassicae (nom. inval.)]
MSSSNSVGWDAPLPGDDAAAAAAAMQALDSFDAIEKTRDVKVDANDYSRFKGIGDDVEADGSKEETKAAAAVVAPAETCRNCHKPGAKLKCSVCKKAVYCARACQASDWTFHKRICKKPAAAPKAPTAASSSSSAAAAATKTSSNSSATTKASGASTATPAVKKTKPASSSTEVVADEPELAADMRGYKNGLPYFHRELSPDEKQLIGDIAPQKIDAPPAPAAAAKASEGSAWNHAGTFEERMFTKWAEAKWAELFTDATFTAGRFAATFKAPEKLTGDASICVVRGKKRFLFDFNFTLPFEVALDGGKVYKGSYAMHEISNDEDYEVRWRPV